MVCTCNKNIVILLTCAVYVRFGDESGEVDMTRAIHRKNPGLTFRSFKQVATSALEVTLPPCSTGQEDNDLSRAQPSPNNDLSCVLNTIGRVSDDPGRNS